MSAPDGSSERVDFATASSVTGRSRHYRAELGANWDGPMTPHGGLLQAILLRAIDAEINTDQRMQARSINCHFLRPPGHGEVDIFVDPVRRGRRFASTRATLSQRGKPCVAAIVSHSVRGMPEIASWGPPAPGVAPAPARNAARRSGEEFSAGIADAWLQPPEGAPRFLDEFLISPRFGDWIFAGQPVEPAVGTTNGGWVMAPEPQPVDPCWLAVVVDAFWPSVLQALEGPAMAPTLDLTTHIRADIPAAGLPDQPLLVHNVSRAAINGLSDSDSFVFSSEGQLLAQARQLQLLQAPDV